MSCLVSFSRAAKQTKPVTQKKMMGREDLADSLEIALDLANWSEARYLSFIVYFWFIDF